MVQFTSSLNGIGVVFLGGDVLEEVLLNLIDLVFESCFFLFLDLLRIWVSLLLWSSFRVVCILFHELNIFLPSRLSLENLLHGLLLLGCGLIEGLAELDDGNGTLGISNGSHVLVDGDGG